MSLRLSGSGRLRRHVGVIALAGAVTMLSACGSDSEPSESTAVTDTTPSESVVSETAPPDTAAETSAAGSTETSAAAGGTAIDPARCERNKAAGTITFLTGFDFAAASSIVEWIVAADKGYFEQLCLDVKLQSSFSSANYALVAAGKAQFASGGSYTEFLRNSPPEDPLQMTYLIGRSPIEVLLVKPESNAKALTDLKGKKIGVKGDLPPAIQIMLFKAGLNRDVDYETVTVDGFDPVQHFTLPIDALPGWRSNEPGRLERSNVPFELFDPVDNGVTGSFGAVFTSKEFAEKNPEVTADVVRAALKGLEDAIADPDGAIALAVQRIEANGNPNFLSPETEGFRWKTEAKSITDLTPSGTAVATIDPALLQAEVDGATDAGVFPVKPDTTGTYLDGMVASVSQPDGRVAFPG
jgi:ABC-type nitrate/sulfonate/bicarbonate transport system substrate-binding protein